MIRHHVSKVWTTVKHEGWSKRRPVGSSTILLTRWSLLIFPISARVVLHQRTTSTPKHGPKYEAHKPSLRTIHASEYYYDVILRWRNISSYFDRALPTRYLGTVERKEPLNCKVATNTCVSCSSILVLTELTIMLTVSPDYHTVHESHYAIAREALRVTPRSQGTTSSSRKGRSACKTIYHPKCLVKEQCAKWCGISDLEKRQHSQETRSFSEFVPNLWDCNSDDFPLIWVILYYSHSFEGFNEGA